MFFSFSLITRNVLSHPSLHINIHRLMVMVLCTAPPSMVFIAIFFANSFYLFICEPLSFLRITGLKSFDFLFLRLSLFDFFHILFTIQRIIPFSLHFHWQNPAFGEAYSLSHSYSDGVWRKHRRGGGGNGTLGRGGGRHTHTAVSAYDTDIVLFFLW